MNRILLLLLLFLMSSLARGQEITGHIIDSKTREPIAGASVYFDGSSMGVISDMKGRFKIHYAAKTHAILIISHMGYMSERIEKPYENSPHSISLVEDVQELPEVILTSDPFSRKQKLKVFRLEFLGDTRASKSCRILNEDAIKLFFNSYDNTLTAYSKAPIIIENSYLGYQIKFDLNEFKIFFKRKSLKRLDNIKYTIYAGYTQFTDTADYDDRIRERRKQAYLGSSMHFMRTCWNNDWSRQNYSFEQELKIVPPSELMESIGSITGDFRTIQFNQEKIVLFHKKKSNYRSTIQIKDINTFSIDKYGKYVPYKNLIFGGHMAELRIADMLPIEYQFN